MLLRSPTPKAAVRDEPHWHAMPVQETFRALDARPEGLSAQEAESRLARSGPNRLRPIKGRGPLLRFLAQFHNLLIYVLIAAAAVTAMLEHWIDSSVILGVVVINALIGFFQEGKAERALDAIRGMLSTEAVVLRDGRRVRIDAEAVVPGDILLLQSGDRIAADARLVKTKSLQTDEAALTGESLPVEKDVAAVPVDAALGDRMSMAHSGTLVTHGQGTALVVATGDATQLGRISTMLRRVRTLTTPLLRQLAIFSRWLTGAISAIAAATFVFGVSVRGFAPSEMFLAAVGLAVAAIPEGLPAIMTITLAIGVQRMARRNAIIRRLPAVETLGSVSVICSDKTGTLTRNEMTVQAIATSRHLFTITGIGYEPHGSFLLDGQEVSPDHRPLLSAMARGALLCCDAAVRQVQGRWMVEGDPTEGALVALAMKAGLDPEFEGKACPRRDEIPFESEHRFMATLHHDHKGHAFVYVKGAPERILEMCDRQYGRDGNEPLNAAYWRARIDEIAGRGQRVLALAMRDVSGTKRDLRFGDVEHNLVLLGLFGLADPPRQEAIDSVMTCRRAGIQVKMITGDHAGTAIAVARQLGLDNPDAALTGSDLEAIGEPDWRRRAAEINVFARTSPEHKLRLVQALQANGQVVAMTGDGVNDAPALKRADVGVAMGGKGTEAAKEAAEMVLADDNFASIVRAVEEGRTVYDNLKKAIIFILPTNGGEAFILIAAIASGYMLPITPVQILWVNMITAVTLALALAFEPPEGAVMQRPPRAPREPVLSRFLIWRVVFVSAILVAGTFGLFAWERDSGADLELARTIAVNTLVMFEVFYLFNTRFLTMPVLNRQGLLGNRAALIAAALVIFFQLLFTYAAPMQLLFATRDIDLLVWLKIVLVASSVFVLVELEKWLLNHRLRRSSARSR